MAASCCQSAASASKNMNSQPVFCSKTIPSSLDSAHRHVELLTTFLKDYKWLTDAYLSDYFILDHSQHIKPSWWNILKCMHLDELASFLKADHWKASGVWPLSLLAFRASIHSLPLQRKPVAPEPYIEKLSHMARSTYPTDLEMGETRAEENRGCNTETTGKDWRCGDLAPIVDIQDGQYLLLEHCYRRHVKPKKQHEILVLAKAVYELTARLPCTYVIDVGAGQGHLSRLLSFGYGLHVTTIEAAGCHAPKATKFDHEVKRDIARGQCISKKRRKKLEDEANPDGLGMTVCDGPNPSHVVAWIDADISVTAFLTSVRAAQHQQTAILEETIHNSVAQTDHTQAGNVSIDKLNRGSHRNQDCTKENLDRNSLGPHSNGLISNRLTSKEDISSSQGDDLFSIHQCVNNLGLTTVHVDRCKGSRGAEECLRSNRISMETEAPPFVLTGLHACGDLTPTMLHVFVSCPQARGLAAVSCCYMKMDIHEADRGDREVGYPLSQCVGSLSGHPLSWEAREMACHFIDAYYDRLTEAHQDPHGQSMGHLRTHCYRAALQEIIMQKDPSVQHGSIKLTLKKAHRLPFNEYAEKALHRLGLDPFLTPHQVRVAQGRVDLWREVVAFYVLRLSLAPLIETVLLLDRIMYLAENGINATLVPVFDPSLSPRNFVLLAIK